MLREEDVKLTVSIGELQQMVLDRDMEIVQLKAKLIEMFARCECLCELVEAIPLETPKNLLEVMYHG